MQVTAVIPARYASTRLPGKALKKIAGQPMIQHVYERTIQAEKIDEVIIATDDQRIYETVEDFGGKVQMTSQDHSTGTDRLAEVAADLTSEIIVNVQGDEPLIKPVMINQAVKPLLTDDSLKMATLKKKIPEKKAENPDLVKVVTDQNEYALYFSRAKIPYSRGAAGKYYKHIGLYVYRRPFLLHYTDLEPTPLEREESLEQLRVLENGYRIKVVDTEYDCIGVDTPEDLKEVRKKIDN